MTGFIGFIVAGLAVLAFITLDRRERRFWQQALSFRLRRIDNTQQNIASEIARNRQEIGAVKETLEETARQTAKAVSSLPVPANAQRPEVFDRIAIEELSGQSMPRALKAAQSYRDIAGESDVSDNLVEQLLRDAVRSERIDLFVQPIVRLPQRKTRFYEMFGRIRARPGLYLPARRYMKLAEEQKLMKDIEQLLLVECLKTLRETADLERAAPFFINVTSSTLKNSVFMKRLLAFLSAQRSLAPRLVFEISQAEYLSMPRAVEDIIRGLGRLGCSFSIDNVKDMNFDVTKMLSHKVQFVKIEAAYLAVQANDENSFAETLKMKRRLEGSGISLIAEKIESERMYKEIMDYDLNYGQGFLFGKPDLQGAYQDRGGQRKIG